MLRDPAVVAAYLGDASEEAARLSLLSVESLDVFYGDVQAVWDVSFRVEAGEIVTLVGRERRREDDAPEDDLRAFSRPGADASCSTARDLAGRPAYDAGRPRPRARCPRRVSSGRG